MTNEQQIIQQLCQLGFTQLESEVYLHLLIHGEKTGYAVAKGIGKAVANVYKGIESLASKGAIEVSVGDSKLCSAVPWKQVLETEKQRFESNMNHLNDNLKQIPEPQDNENVYQLNNIHQVLQACENIIANAEQIIVADFDPKVAAHFAPFLQDAVKRGVEVRVKIYQPLEIKGAQLTLRPNGQQVYAQTGNESFRICADGKESLTAVVSADLSAVIQAFKSKSALVCMDMYCGLIYELILTELKQAIPNEDLQACQKILNDTEHLHPFSTRNTVFTQYKNRYQQQEDLYE